jgi:hypothetical protein
MDGEERLCLRSIGSKLRLLHFYFWCVRLPAG